MIKFGTEDNIDCDIICRIGERYSTRAPTDIGPQKKKREAFPRFIFGANGKKRPKNTFNFSRPLFRNGTLDINKSKIQYHGKL